MDRRSRLNHEGGDKSTDGKDKAKDAALDKLRQMEWMRNKEDTWHLARSNSKKGEGYVKKNKDEENYFEGTGNQKIKKNRKTRSSEAVVPPAFSMAVGSSAPPAVNAWSQKKGSALFNKPEEVDEEDEMLKLALKESLKTAEEDERRKLERMRMSVVEDHSNFKSKAPTEQKWEAEHYAEEEEDLYQDVEDEYYNEVEKFSPSLPSSNRDLQFIDTDESSPPPSQRRKPQLSKARKSSNPDENISARTKNNIDPSHSFVRTPPSTGLSDFNESFGTSRNIFQGMGENTFGQLEQSLLNDPIVPRKDESKDFVVPEQKNNILPVDDLSLNFSSNLTFCDTQRSSESSYDNYNHVSQDVTKPYHFETQNYGSKEQNHSLPILVPKSSPSCGSSGISNNIEDTDLFLHSILRHDPPTVSLAQSPIEMFAQHNAQQYLPPHSDTFEQNEHVLNGFKVSNITQPDLKNCIRQDPKISESNLPFQNVNSFGSMRKDTFIGLQENVEQSENPHLPFAMNVQNNPEVSSNMQSTVNCNLASQMTYSGVPPGYALFHQSVPSGLNQFGYPNANMALPQDLTPHQYQQAMNAYDQFHQIQLNNLETNQKEQIKAPNQSQLSPGETQPQILPQQNHLQMLQLYQQHIQMAALWHHQMNLQKENLLQKANDFPHENKQQSTDQQGIQPTNKTFEELQQDYFQTMQYARHLQQQLANVPQQLSNIPQQLANAPQQLANLPQQLTNLPQQVVNVPQQLANVPQQLANLSQQSQPLHYNFSHQLPISNLYYPSMQVVTSTQQPLPVAQTPAHNIGQSPPLTQPGFPNIQPLINNTVADTPSLTDQTVGRGRGRRL